MSVAQLLIEALGAQVPSSVTASGLSLDSRQVKPGDAFIALHADRDQRQRHIAAAIKAGAVAILADGQRVTTEELAGGCQIVHLPSLRMQLGRLAATFYGHPARQLRICGVTGTNGKTSVSCYAAQLLGRITPAGVIGTVGYGPLESLSPLGMTTPDAVRLQAILADLVAGGCRDVVMEVSSHALAQDRIAELPITVAAFTNLTRDHLDYHGDMDAYGKAKQRLFERGDVQSAVLNLDDSFGRKILGALPSHVQCVGYGMEPGCTAGLPRRLDQFIVGRVAGVGAGGTILPIGGSFGDGVVETPLLGTFNVANVLAAAAIALLRGLPFAELAPGIAQLRAASGRLERVGGDGGRPTVVIDFAHTPDALEKALITLRSICAGRLICVFGCGGDRDKGKRALMGEVVERLADLIIITSDNPRNEDPLKIIDGVMAGLQQPARAKIIPDRHEAITEAVVNAEPSDTILIAGKGHENYQEIRGQRWPWSDRDVVMRILGALRP